MSAFIVPISSLPTLESLRSVAPGDKIQDAGQQTGTAPFADILNNALQNLVESSADSQGQMLGLALGSSDDLHTGAIASLKSSVAISFASGLASTAIRSYNELMRTQI